MNLLQHKNFSLAPEYIGKIDTTTAEGVLTTHLQELALKLFAKNPSWCFELDQTWHSATTDAKIIFHSFKVMDSNGVKLGEVGQDWRYGQGGKVQLYVIYNKRFQKSNKRTASLPTAMRDIQKTFRADTHDELTDTAMDKFVDISRAQARTKTQHLNRSRNEVKDAAYTFAMRADQKNNFADYCKKHNKGADEALSSGAKLQLEIKTIEDIVNMYAMHRTCLLIRHENSWIMRIADDAKVCNDSSLPNDVRMKLGMLKLVDDDQFIENVGCRVNSYTFVVTLEQGETE